MPESFIPKSFRLFNPKFLLPLCAVFFTVPAFSQAAADLIVTDAKVWTGDSNHPTAEAVAVIGDRIVAVGSVHDINSWRGPQTRILDAGGKLLIPGFNDAHVHFVEGGAQLDSIQLNDATSAAEFARRVAERARSTPKGEWIRNGGWDETKWNPPQLPTKELIDSATPDNPIFLDRYDGHMALANSVALRMAGITAHTPDPPGGVIVRDEKGNPTGALKDAAKDFVLKVIPPLPHDQRITQAQRALAYAASLGVTSVQEMNDEETDSFANIEVYSELLERGELTARIYAAPAITDWQTQARAGIRHGFGSSYLRMGAVKGFADGSLGSRTAYFFQSYSDAPNTFGLLHKEMQPLSRMQNWMIQADAAGLQICTHAIGDRAISTVLDLYAEVEKTNGASDRRFRIEHSQHVAAKDFDRFAQLHVIASVQPYQAIDDGRWAEKRIGHERAGRTYPFRTFLDHRVRLAFGTDWPVVPLNPLLGIYAAVTRATLDGKYPGGWFPEQKLTVPEAVEAYTMGSAYAEFQDKEKGSITAGKLADMVILSEDIFSMDSAEIKNVKVVNTIVGGKVVWDAGSQKRSEAQH